MEDNCEYTEYIIANSRQGVVLQFRGLGEGLTTPRRKNSARYGMLRRDSGFSRCSGTT
jgi:hypothetical protein